MKLPEAKKAFAHLMKVSQQRPLTDLEKRTLTRARQTLRKHAKSAMNPRKPDYFTKVRTGRHTYEMQKEPMRAGTPVMHKKKFEGEYSYGRVKRFTASGDVLVKWDTGETTYEPKYNLRPIFETPGWKLPNPRSRIKIYGRCLRIEAVKTTTHTYGGKRTRAGQKYFHDFSTKHSIIYGLPDGSLLIKATR